MTSTELLSKVHILANASLILEKLWILTKASVMVAIILFASAWCLFILSDIYEWWSNQ